MMFKSVISKKSRLNRILTLTLFVPVVFLVVVLVLPQQAVGFTDDFNKNIGPGVFTTGTWDVDWDYSLQNVTNFTAQESGGNLTVTDIATTSTGWGNVIFSHILASPDNNNFGVDFDFSWDSGGRNDARQAVQILLYDATGSNLIARAGYNDNFTGPNASGGIAAKVGTGAPLSPVQGSLGLSGSASVDINREGSTVKVFWDGVERLSGTSNTSLGRVDIMYSYRKNGSTYGSNSVDFLATAPEPVSSALFVIGGAIFGVRSFMRKKKQNV
jgi:hypothetical protein